MGVSAQSQLLLLLPHEYWQVLPDHQLYHDQYVTDDITRSPE